MDAPWADPNKILTKPHFPGNPCCCNHATQIETGLIDSDGGNKA